MKVMLFDCETTGLNFDTDRIIEVGAAITDETFTVQGPTFSELMWESGYPALTEEIQKLTGITADDLLEKSKTPAAVMQSLNNWIAMEKPDFFVAYNKDFDERMFRMEATRFGPHGATGIALAMVTPWVCAMKDVESNLGFKCWKLSHLALDRGLAVDPADLHRALDDVLLMRRMLVKAGANVRDMYAYQQEPMLYIRALVPHPRDDKDGKKKEIAKKAGFNYQQAKGDTDGPVFEKCWVKKIKAKNLELEGQNCLLPIRVIEEV